MAPSFTKAEASADLQGADRPLTQLLKSDSSHSHLAQACKDSSSPL